MTEFETELLKKLIEELELEDDVELEDVKPEAPLYGYDNDGLGLDSIDFLEVAVMLNKHFGVVIKEEGEQNREIFASLRSLAAFVQAHRNP